MAYTHEDTEKNVDFDQVETVSPAESQREKEDQEYAFTFKTLLAMLALQSGYMADIFVSTMTFNQVSAINAAVGPSIDNGWLIGSFAATSVVLNPIFGHLGDIYGKRYFLLAGSALAVVGCLVAATSHSINTLIVANALLGTASAMHQLAWTCIVEMVPMKKRPTTLGLLQASFFPATIFSPWIGIAMVTYASWRDIYWLGLAINIFSLAGLLLFYHPTYRFDTEEHGSPLQPISQFDFLGAFLWTSGLILGGAGLTFGGGGKFHWISIGVMVPAFIGLVCLIAFGFWLVFNKSKYVVFPREVMKNFREVGAIVLTLVCIAMTYQATLDLWPAQIQVLYSQDPNKMGLYQIAFGLAGTLAAPIAGMVMENTGQGKWILTVSSALLTVFVGAQAIISSGSHIASTLLVCLTGAMVGAIIVCSTAMIQLAVPYKYLAFATGLAFSMRNVGATLAETVDHVIVGNQLTALVASRVAPALAAAGVPLAQLEAAVAALLAGDVTSPALASASPAGLGAAVLALQLSYARAFQIVFYVTISFGVLGTVLAALSRDSKKSDDIVN